MGKQGMQKKSTFELPVAGETDFGGLTFKARAIPYGLAKKAASIGGDDEKAQAYCEEFWNKCVFVEDGEKPSIDDVPLSLVNALISIASDKDAASENFQKPRSR